MPSSRTKLRRENFRFICKLGEGKFGKVFMVKEIQTGLILAMKIVEKGKIMRENLLEQFIR
jgi:serine/threonine protein kinase